MDCWALGGLVGLIEVNGSFLIAGKSVQSIADSNIIGITMGLLVNWLVHWLVGLIKIHSSWLMTGICLETIAAL